MGGTSSGSTAEGVTANENRIPESKCWVCGVGGSGGSGGGGGDGGGGSDGGGATRAFRLDAQASAKTGSGDMGCSW